jgi:hypothetical protein
LIYVFIWPRWSTWLDVPAIILISISFK